MAAFKKKSYPGGARPSKQVSQILIKTSARFECLEDDTFACALCTGKFITVAELLHHHLRKHQDDWHYWCNICNDLVGVSPNQLNKHIKMHPVGNITVSDSWNDVKGTGVEKTRRMKKADAEESDDLFEEETPEMWQNKSGRGLKDKGKLSALPESKNNIVDVAFAAEEGNSQDEIFDAESLGPWAIRLKDEIEFSDDNNDNNGADDDNFDDFSEYNKAVYCCSFCTVTFATLRELINHTNSYHRPTESTHYEKKKQYQQKETPNDSEREGDAFNCGLCKYFSSRSKAELEKHICQHLQPTIGRRFTDNVCQFCGKTFAFVNSLRTHMKYHTNELPFTCDHCGKKYPLKHLLETHIRNVHNQERPHKCTDCPNAYKTGLGLRRHMVSNHGAIFEHQCAICDFAASTAGALKYHRKRYGGNCLPVCKFCGLKCKRAALTRHEQTHLGKLFECSVCSRKFSRRCALNDHLNSHEGSRPYQCEKCNESFANYYTWYGHKRTDCGKFRVEKGKVTERARERAGGCRQSSIFTKVEDWFQCNECDFQSKFKGTVYAHYKCKHTAYEKKPKPVFECSFCGKLIRKKYNFEGHLNAHMGVQPYECKGCPKKFGSRLSLYQHTANHCPGNRKPKPVQEKLKKSEKSKAPPPPSPVVKMVPKGSVHIKMADRMYVSFSE